jgi:hypothetical protein
MIGDTIRLGFLNPEFGINQTMVLNGIPKRESPPPLERKARNGGWSFCTGQGLSMWRISAWCLAITIIVIVFVPFWLLLVDDLDLQNAFVPVTFLTSPVVIWLGIASLGSLAWTDVYNYNRIVQ